MKRHDVYGRTYEECVAERDRQLVNMRAGVPEPDRKHSLAAWLPLWIDSIPTSRLAPQSRDKYQTSIAHWSRSALAGRKLADLTPTMVSTALARMEREHGLTAATQASALSVLRLALDVAVKDGHAGRNVARLVDAPRHDVRPIAPPRGEHLESLVRLMELDRDRALWMLALHAGIRQGELLALTWSDVNLDAGLVRVDQNRRRNGTLGDTKSRKSRRTLPITPEWTGVDLVAELRAHRRRQLADGVLATRVFVKRDGRDVVPMTAYDVYDRWRQLNRAAGIPEKLYRFHDLRHAAATALVKRLPVATASRYLGHATLAQTDVYVHTELTEQTWIEPVWTDVVA